MAATLVDNVRVNVTSMGAGALALGSAVDGYRGVEALQNGKTYNYKVVAGSQWELGQGQYLTSGNQLVRTPLYSSNGDGLVDLAQNAQVSFVALSTDFNGTGLSADAIAARDQAVAAAALAQDSANAATAIVGPVASLLTDAGAGLVGTTGGGSVQDFINAILSTAAPGALTVGMKGEGAGATSSTVAAFLWHFVIHLTDYYTGTLTTGADITSALTKAVAAAAARRQALGGVGRIYIPAGYYYTLSATIVVPSFVEIHGAGKVETYLRRTGNYGNSFEFGTANPAANVQCCGISNLTIFHDHGNGTTAPADPANWVNSVTGSPAHVVAYTPVACCFERLDLNMLPLQFVCQGGSKSIFRSIDTYGVYDDANAAMQEGLAGFLMAADASVTASIPTWHLIDNCRFGGATRASTSVTYYGANTKTTTKNIGPQNGLVIWCAESLVINGCYTGACNSNGILISSKSTDIIAGIFIMGHFFDPCGVKYQDACLKFENRDTSGAAPDGVSVIGCQFKGQLNGWRAISDWGNTNTLGSVKDLIVEGCSGSNFVGNPVELYNDRNSRIEANWSAYNCMNWYSGDQACAVHIASGSINPTINGTLGGGTYGETTPGTNNRCVDGVRVDAWATSKPRLSVSSGGMSGSLIVGKPGPASVTVTSSPFTYTAGPQNETLYIYGGTVSLITQGGVTIATSTGLSVSLSPGEACVVTYSAAPTIKVKLQ